MESPDQKRAKRIRTAPTRYQGVLARALGGTASPRVAIKAMCLECIGFQRAAVAERTGYVCPLWSQRPYQSPVLCVATTMP